MGKCVIHQSLHLAIFPIPAGEAVAVGDAAQVFVDHGNGVKQSVEQDGVGGFLAHAGQCQKLTTDKAGRLGREPCQGGIVLLIEKGDKCLDGRSFANHVSRGADERTQFILGNCPQAVEVHHAVCDQVGDGAFHPPPGGVLGQVSADDHLQSGLRRPPLLGAIGSGQLVVKIAQNGPQRLCSWRRLLLLQLFLPAQQLGLQRLGLCLGDHALVLIQDGEAGMGQHFFRVELEQALRHGDSPIEVALFLQRADEPVHGIEHAGIHFEAAAKAFCGGGRVAFGEPVEGLVIELFGSENCEEMAWS